MAVAVDQMKRLPEAEQKELQAFDAIASRVATAPTVAGGQGLRESAGLLTEAVEAFALARLALVRALQDIADSAYMLKKEPPVIAPLADVTGDACYEAAAFLIEAEGSSFEFPSCVAEMAKVLRLVELTMTLEDGTPPTVLSGKSNGGGR